MNLFRIQKRFPVPFAVRARSDPAETLKFDSGDSAKIDLQGARRRALMYKISAGRAEKGRARPRTRRQASSLYRIPIKSRARKQLGSDSASGRSKQNWPPPGSIYCPAVLPWPTTYNRVRK